MNRLTIVMYHYVRSREHGRYPNLRVRDTVEFRAQLDYIQEHYIPVSADDVALALDGGHPLPERACLLTFDDGYLDHFITVFPELARRGLSGAFYPPVEAIQGQKILEVNKIQLLLAQYGYGDVHPLLEKLEALYGVCQCEDGSGELNESFTHLRQRLTVPSRFDSADIMFVKALLQYALPPFWRTRLLDRLFAEVMETDEKVIAAEMYMSLDMLRVMAKSGMHVGSHGASHVWLDKLSADEQALEIDQSLAMLAEVYGTRQFLWSMCYPFGGNNDDTRRLCSERGCAFGVTTVPNIAELNPEQQFKLSRLDTNDIIF